MRSIVYGSLALAFVLGFIFWVGLCGRSVEWEPLSAWLEIGGILVGVCSIASISFAVVSFLSTHGIKTTAEEAAAILNKQRLELEQKIKEIQSEQYLASTIVLKSIVKAFMTLKSLPEFQSCIQQITRAEIEIHFSSGEKIGFMRAMELSFKLDSRRFFDMEKELWEKTNRMKSSEGAMLRSHYLELKENLLEEAGL